jgi:predicted transposase/invertase (TIGR01784 family)
MGLLPRDIFILPPSDDRIFKLILTSPEGKPALMDLICATIKRPVIDVVVRNNELPHDDTGEKAARLDVNCRIDDGSQIDLEMQASHIEEMGGEHKNLKGKSIYYLCDLHSSQPAKGMKRYDKLVQTYQVTFCSYTVFPDLPGYVNSFSMRHDMTNKLLSDAINATYVELSKLSEILKKSVCDMTDMDKWAVFFRYANIPECREIVNKVIESKEVLQMAGNLLMSVSQSEQEQAIFRSRRMYQSDQESNLATAEAKGEARGEVRGKREGIVLMASRLKEAGAMPIEEIARISGLTLHEVKKL